MKEEKESFILYKTQCRSLLKLPTEQRGELITAVIRLAFEGETPTFDDLACDVLFDQISDQITRDKEKYAKRCAKNRDIALQREEAKRTNVNERERTYTNSTDTDTDTVTDTVTDTGNDTVTDNDAAVQRIFSEWNNLPGVIKVKRTDGGRIKTAKQCIQQNGLEDVMKAVQTIKGCPFLLGENDTGWVISFDWFMKQENFTKVLEGNYLKRKKDHAPGQYDFYENDWTDLLKG